MKPSIVVGAGLSAALWLAPALAAAQDSDAARAARYLAANCANCHGTDGRAHGAMPSLMGKSKQDLLEQLIAFREGKRPATLMHQISKGYTPEQLEAIADHFARQKPAN